jgi:hypothetical protein
VGVSGVLELLISVSVVVESAKAEYMDDDEYGTAGML